MKVNVKQLHENATIPTYAHEGDACFDLSAATVYRINDGAKYISSGETILCGTGLAFDIPAGSVMLVFSRGGHGFKHNIRLSNCTGVIDHGYTGEVMVKLICDSQEFEQPYTVRVGDRIAQAMIIPVESCTFEVVEQLTLSERGSNGFGSSGDA